MRERLCFAAASLPTALRRFVRENPGTEIAVVSTCNRIEVYTAVPPRGPDHAAVLDFVARQRRVAPAEFREFAYHYRDADAIRHLFKVAAGLDSLVLGEPQVMAQVKQALAVATEAGTAGKVLQKTFQSALAAARTVHRKSRINEGHVSIGSVAADFARRISADFKTSCLLVIGAGDMGKLVLEQLAEGAPSRMLVCNRHRQRSEEIVAKYGGEVVEFEGLTAALAQADVVISSTSAPHYVVTAAQVRSAMEQRRGKPLFFIDIAVPRDIEPAVLEVPNTYLYNVDDLQALVAENLAARSAKLDQCNELIEKQMAGLVSWMESLHIEPTITRLRETFHAIKAEELGRLNGKLSSAGEADRQLIEQAAERIVNKLLHAPCNALKDPAARRRQYDLEEAIEEIFGLSANTDGDKQDS